MALGVSDILVQARLYKLLLLGSKPLDFLGEVGDGEIQDEGHEHGQDALCQSHLG